MNGKGVTPVVATVLLLTISIAATGTAYTYITGMQSDFREQIEDFLQDKKVKENSDLNIQKVTHGTGDFTILNVRNSGTISQSVEGGDGTKHWTLFVDNRPVGSDGTGWKYIGGRPEPSGEPVKIPPSEVIQINSTEPFPNSGQQKEFKLVGRHGSEDAFTCYSASGNSC